MIKWLIRTFLIAVPTQVACDYFKFADGTWSRFFAYFAFFILFHSLAKHAFEQHVYIDGKKFEEVVKEIIDEDKK